MGFTATELDWYINPVPANRGGEISLDQASHDSIKDLATIETILSAAELTKAAIDPDLCAKLTSLAERANKLPKKKFVKINAMPTVKEAIAPPKPTVIALSPKKWTEFPLEQRIDINHNTRRLRFRLPCEDLGLPVGMHIFLKGSVDGKPVMRAYTPVLVGPYFVDFVIKVHLSLPA